MIRRSTLFICFSLFTSDTTALIADCHHTFYKKHSTTLLRVVNRRLLLQEMGTLGLAVALKPELSLAGEFTPGGTLVDRVVGAQVGNPEASASRKFDNSNVLFYQDHFFKFGVAAPWITSGSTDFPKSMPFVVSQQRYDNLKKYGERVKSGVKVLVGLRDIIMAEGDYTQIPGPDAPEYQLRPLGLLANGMMASENTGATNELFLARWYVNEIYLDINDIRNAKSEEEALVKYEAIKKAVDSYYGMINRVITSKVGDKFHLLVAQ
ncbi:predicted protein [Phaeodactylum tricornutum CCAP 1055/1]|jgi:hypothetical protein|uniref:Uncharacterized protein n=1 Tax=Phaeodactylum tricornutum (strain CCAP 1055/1) TaxID=556484 RepID=B7FP17_PHATC|nr:predicted protein [Phaeodactylum tricornutum CCAP 1055/1]EEC51601.1 predicted protein [Phaeodactylum tricornutum CCAP 1055/1]|eukprot:XP_002177138.1 predicted protein [Phaeodactylum tricornutum CCAP 1055/1]